MVIGDAATAMMLHQTRGARDLGRGEIGAVQRQQVMTVETSKELEQLAALQTTEDRAEPGPQTRGIEGIEDVRIWESEGTRLIP